MKYLLLLISALSLAQTKQEIKEATKRRDEHLFSVLADPKKFTDSVKFEYVHDEPLMPVIINGKQYTFLFDTGAVTILTPQLVKELGLQPISSNDVLDANGNVEKREMFTLPELSVSGVSFSKIGCVSADLSSFSTLLCRPIDGIFGTNIMRLANWKIDYQNSLLSFSTDKLQPDSEFDKEDFEPNFSGSPVISVITGKVRFPALIDSGNNRSLDIPTELYDKTNLSKTSPSRASSGHASFALGGNSFQKELAVRADTLYFGNRLMQKQPIRVSPGSPVLIGNQFLKQFGQVVISWKKSEIYLPKKMQEREPDKSFGISPLLTGDRIEVSEVWEGSQAEKHGISVGDTLLKINGIVTSPATHEIWCELMAKTEDAKSLSIELKKANGKTESFTLESFDVFQR